jgi:hypothetical protein
MSVCAPVSDAVAPRNLEMRSGANSNQQGRTGLGLLLAWTVVQPVSRTSSPSKRYGLEPTPTNRGAPAWVCCWRGRWSSRCPAPPPPPRDTVWSQLQPTGAHRLGFVVGVDGGPAGVPHLLLLRVQHRLQRSRRGFVVVLMRARLPRITRRRGCGGRSNHGDGGAGGCGRWRG